MKARRPSGLQALWSKRRGRWIGGTGIGLVLAGLVVSLVYFTGWVSLPPRDLASVSPQELANTDVLRLQQVVYAPSGSDEARRAFRPQSGTVLGEDIVFVDALAGTLLASIFHQALTRVPLNT